MIRLFDMVMGLCTAADLVSPAVANHHKRVAYISLSIAEELKQSAEELHDIVLAASLHDIGALSLRERMDLLAFESNGVGRHAELGYLFLRRFQPFAQVASIIRYHHQYWNNGAGSHVDGQPVPLASHVLHLADRIDILIDNTRGVLGQAAGITAHIRERSGAMFMPELVATFESVAPKEFFWLDIVSPRLDNVLQRRVGEVSMDLSPEGLAVLAKLLSHIIDFKSPFTVTHSAGVSATAEALASLAGFSPAGCLQMRIAGFLHDLGKLAIPAEILEKPADLTSDEMDQIRTHTYYTRRILEDIPDLNTITHWASSHHERLDGQGYPFHSTAEELQLGARVVAVADVFTALTEDRPYRQGLSRPAVEEIMRKMVSDGKLDWTVFDLLELYYDDVNGRRLAAQAEAAEEYRQLAPA